MVFASDRELEIGIITMPDHMRLGRTEISPQPIRVIRESSYEEWVAADPEVNGQFSALQLATYYGGAQRIYFYEIESD